ncbi:M23 family metallopeptidase [Mycobacteroides franklinii]|uniref:Murein hydrolase activator NlpD n=1 Tax=Mycobacteroides franklinii TaxID=948102 RepID=A0A4R8QY99_9MYCO|nr:M23 family metallopeptidase [Mycobacteroides franklinii]TDZ41683.1 Murein hydrolase activator NlpD precursor [Mycobacteroides franklinii]TDZ47108.1 Murein hydrolase activator NlpD precursor [Mycobacteroides franklinii]TDZ55237.1 Murein hydrolase activator NlpD precursor [Mycobacteroides franklinii]TDZ62178.1 Murein hydrolase activator NlpD precursor [Mycobacteroides franklinii]TDZ68576.1 Murein hydrolase activator NlpD precursor [Mycobacteroides franklinii]
MGVRIENAVGTPVLAAADGLITRAGTLASNDTVVAIQHPDGVVTQYWHVDTWVVSPSQPVKAGEQIATFGENRHADGLYFQVSRDGKPTDARAWLASHGAQLGLLEF